LRCWVLISYDIFLAIFRYHWILKIQKVKEVNKLRILLENNSCSLCFKQQWDINDCIVFQSCNPKSALVEAHDLLEWASVVKGEALVHHRAICRTVTVVFHHLKLTKFHLNFLGYIAPHEGKLSFWLIENYFLNSFLIKSQFKVMFLFHIYLHDSFVFLRCD